VLAVAAPGNHEGKEDDLAFHRRWVLQIECKALEKVTYRGDAEW
jgi:hypothetical protein